MTCENDDSFMRLQMIPFTYPGWSNAYEIGTDGELNPEFNEFFAVNHAQGTHIHTLVIFNATISPTDGLEFSTAGMFGCFNNLGNGKVNHMVVVRKYINSLNHGN